MRGRRLLCLLLLLQLLAAGLPRAGTPARAAGCAREVEPNETLETGGAFTGAGCFTGEAPDGDQDVWLWTVPAGPAARWSFTLTGVPGTVNGLKLVAISSAPGATPITAGATLLEVATQPETTGPVTVADVLIGPGTYILGFSRSATASGDPPTTTAYSFAVEPGAPLPPNDDAEPNDDLATAAPLTGAFAISGDHAGTTDRYAWTLSAADAERGWTLTAQTLPGGTLPVSLLDADGNQLASYAVDGSGRLAVADLVFPAGVIYLEVAPSTDPGPYVLAMSPGELPAADREPNDDPAGASPLDPAHPVVTGRLDHDGDRDLYALTVNAALAGTLFDAKLFWRSSANRSLCIDDLQGNRLQCRSGAGGVALANVLLPAGDYLLEISGDAGLDDPYLLRLDPTAAPAGGYETEPNDAVTTASAMAVDRAFSGRLDGSEDDFVRVLVTGDPQLWRLDATGSGIGRVSLVDPAGSELMGADVAADGTAARISDLFFVPGEHWFRVSGTDGEYTLRLTPLGPPDPNAEREPNNASVSAEPLPLGIERTGRIPEVADADVYRFSLAATEHVILRLTPPQDGAVALRLDLGRVTVASARSPVVGQPIVYDAQLLPGDYELWLTAGTPSEGRYALTVERADPFLLAADQEPNDTAAQARPFPAAGSVTGTAGEFADDDWYALPPTNALTGLAITASGAVTLTLTDGTTDYPLTAEADGATYRSGRIPIGARLLLRVSGSGPYTLKLGSAAANADGAPAVTATLTAETDRVAAYWQEGQVVHATLTLANTGTNPESLALDAVTSHYAWSVALDQATVELPASGRAEIPVTIRALPDGWAGVPVRVTVRARTGAGQAVTAYVDVTPDRDAPAVNPEQAWSVPDALLGGLDVASLGLGAKVIPSVDQAMEEQLHDGVTPAGAGFYQSSPALPLTLTVDLAGEDLVPVAGIVLNPQGSDAGPDELPRGFDLLLSEDGTTYTIAFSGELSPLPIDQPFVLPQPVSARYAQLRITGTYGAAGGGLSLGEWKVIASPGTTPEPAALNVADPGLGGHVVFMDPQSEDINFPNTLLTADGARSSLSVSTGARPTWVLGFAHDRAAQITRLEWVDPPGSTPDTRFTRVTVEVSTTSPLGPWSPIGTWALERDADGSVAPLALAEPTWARFLRFTGNGPDGSDANADWEYPDAIRVVEQATGDDYRSVVGEWGQNAPVGPYQWLHPETAPAIPPDKGDDSAESAQPLAANQTASDRVQIGTDVDWYAVTAPANRDGIAFTVTGDAYVGVELSLWDTTGVQVPMTVAPGGGDVPATVYTATVTPGAGYRLKVEQPAHSVVFSYDTSMSMGAYEPFVREALRAYAGAIQPGQEFVNVLPFEAKPLLDRWSDQGYEVQSAVESTVDETTSSSAETALIDGSNLLATQEGARAILLVTDAETSSYARGAELWGVLAAVRPIVFAVQVAANTTPLLSQHYMEDWAAAGGGFYQYTRSHGEMDRAFDRLATWLRRPIAYGLSYAGATVAAATPSPEPTATATATPTAVPTATPEPTAPPTATEPATPTPTPTPTPTATATAAPSNERGSLQVIAGDDGGGGGQATAGNNVAVEIILDTSGSMLAPLADGQTRIDVAKAVLTDLVTTKLPPGAPIALRVFGDQPDSCETRLAAPVQPLAGEVLAAQIAAIPVVNLVRTPIGAALEQVAADLADVDGPKIVILVTDGEETCGGDPEAAIRGLIAQGIDVQVNIVGFALDDEQMKATFAEWARLGNGSYFDATDADELDRAVARAAAAPFRVYDANGDVVASGTAGGQALKLPPGTYTVVVLTDPVTRIEGVVVSPGEKTKVTVGG